MEWRKLKNIIILVLLLVNGFLLVIVTSRMGEVRRYEQAALEQACRVLENNGIRVKQSGLEQAEGLTSLSAVRSIDGEKMIAEAILGEGVSGENQSGGLYAYRSDGGTVSFRSGGQIYAWLEDNDRWHTANPEEFSLELFSGMGLKGRVMQTSMLDGTGTITLCQLLEEVPLFSCRVMFTFEEGRLISLTGTVMTGEAREEESGSLLTMPTALLRFMEGVLASGDVCSRIDAMEPGYRTVRSFSSAMRLEPVWLVSTNAADYYVDAVTGELQRLTDE